MHFSPRLKSYYSAAIEETWKSETEMSFSEPSNSSSSSSMELSADLNDTLCDSQSQTSVDQLYELNRTQQDGAGQLRLGNV